MKTSPDVAVGQKGSVTLLPLCHTRTIRAELELWTYGRRQFER